MKTFLTICLVVIAIVFAATPARAQTTGPTLLTQENSTRAGAVDSVTLVRDPLPIASLHNFSQDRRGRVTLFGTNMDLLPGENASAVTALARDSQSRNYNLTVESVRKVPGVNALTQVVVKFPDTLAHAGDVWVSVNLGGQTSNEVLVNIEVQTEPRRVTLVARRVINGRDTWPDAVYSFEFSVNGELSMPFTLNDWDVLFGNDPNVDSFDVSLAGGDRSRIKDMGPLNWNDTFQVPVLTPHPTAANEPEANAIVGHMYAVHTKDPETDLYFLFRVEAIDPGKSVTITWKGVRSPDGN